MTSRRNIYFVFSVTAINKEYLALDILNFVWICIQIQYETSFYMFTYHVMSVRNFEVVYDQFNIVGIFTRENYAEELIMKREMNY
jgi:hypothetical protein